MVHYKHICIGVIIMVKLDRPQQAVCEHFHVFVGKVSSRERRHGLGCQFTCQ